MVLRNFCMNCRNLKMAAKSGGQEVVEIGDQEWTAFVAEVKACDVGTQRAVASVFGALVADAAGNDV